MAEPHELLNALDPEAAAAALRRCCGAERWVRAMLAARPFLSMRALHERATSIWNGLTAPDYLEAFSHHPQIGENLEELRRRFTATHTLSAREQAGVSAADEGTLLALREGNRAYRERFGHIFIVCATGKTAAEMLALLQQRLSNEPAAELAIAAAEQAKITRLRLDGLGTSEPAAR
ncbi:MAG TPA: 2-oxo-4-hydroxy-4-carboxy-5-ureidoimidazoline decarboxylase [Polyangiaceae bacterium]|nr:2-oxo-4-hydroxy-4-carboxy-5-ureidoimidazoline decarboxylase [Polyangiaceae bacterium]